MPETEAVDLLRRTLASYHGLSSYQDEGTVIARSPSLESGDATTFETLFSRPSLFRFKFASPHPYPPLAHVISTHICGSDSLGAYMWTKQYEATPTIESCESTLMAIAAATGISSGAAYTIGQLLVDGFEGGRGYGSMENMSLEEDERVDGALCKVVRGRHADPDVHLTLLIDPVTLTFRAIRSQFAEFESEEVRRNIRLNERIDASRFERQNCEI